MPRVDVQQMEDGRISLVWDWDGTDDDLRAFLRESEDLGKKASYAVAVDGRENLVWYGGTVRNTRGNTILNMRREINGLREQSGEYSDQDNYLGAVGEAYHFEGVGLSAQIW